MQRASTHIYPFCKRKVVGLLLYPSRLSHIRACSLLYSGDRSFASLSSSQTDQSPHHIKTDKNQNKFTRLSIILLKLSAASIGLLFAYYYVKDTRASIHSFIPILFRGLDPERSHEIIIWLGQHGLLPIEHAPTPEILYTKVWDIDFDSPIGLAAGFDKDGKAIDSFAALGFGFIEIGSVTPLAQPGNEIPRVFRLTSDRAVINRYGFNSHGLDTVYLSLLKRYLLYHHYYSNPSPGSLPVSLKLKQLFLDSPFPLFSLKSNPPVIGVNIGKNKVTSEENAVNDYIQGVKKLGMFADYIVINVSSPNTPGLRNLQTRDKLLTILCAVIKAREEISMSGLKNTFNKLPPICVKISPDMDDHQLKDILLAVKEAKIDGIIVSNTTISRPREYLTASEDKMNEAGGLSGKPIFEISTNLLRKVYKETKGEIPIIASGGVMNAEDAFEKLKSGASLVQLYTGFIYGGAGTVTTIKKDLAKLITENGYNSVKDVIGVSVK